MQTVVARKLPKVRRLRAHPTSRRRQSRTESKVGVQALACRSRIAGCVGTCSIYPSNLGKLKLGLQHAATVQLLNFQRRNRSALPITTRSDIPIASAQRTGLRNPNAASGTAAAL